MDILEVTVRRCQVNVVLLRYISISTYKCYKKVLISLKSQCSEVHISLNVSRNGIVSVVSICIQVLI